MKKSGEAIITDNKIYLNTSVRVYELDCTKKGKRKILRGKERIRTRERERETDSRKREKQIAKRDICRKVSTLRDRYR